MGGVWGVCGGVWGVGMWGYAGVGMWGLNKLLTHSSSNTL